MTKKKKLEELGKFVPSIEVPVTEPLNRDAPILFDGKQYSVRIPKEMFKRLDIDLKKDKFHFHAEIEPAFSYNSSTLTGELIRGKKNDKK